MSKDKKKEQKTSNTDWVNDVHNLVSRVHNETNRFIECETQNLVKITQLCINAGQKAELKRIRELYKGMAEAIDDLVEQIDGRECGAIGIEVKELTNEQVEELKKQNGAEYIITNRQAKKKKEE